MPARSMVTPFIGLSSASQKTPAALPEFIICLTTVIITFPGAVIAYPETIVTFPGAISGRAEPVCMT